MSPARSAEIIEIKKAADHRTEAMVKACLSLVEAMSPMEREDFLRQLMERLRPIPVPKAGDVLSVVVQLMPRGREWSVKELKRKVEEAGSSASDKEIYNAVGYLTRKSRISRLGQGRYIINGAAVVSADDFGGLPSPNEGDLNDY